MTDFDRKKSTNSVGQLYPILLSKDGQVIDGFHRLDDDSGWKTETLDHIDSEEKLLLARAISNWHRREVPRHEKEDWINGLAKIYEEQGYKVGDKQKGEPNDIITKIYEETGISRDTIHNYISQGYKQLSLGGSPKGTARVPASQRIETELGQDFVERHETEVLEKALEDPDFIVKAIERAPQVLATKPAPVVDREGYHKPTVEKIVQDDAREKSIEVESELEIFRDTPELRDKSRLMKAWRALGVILTTSKDLVCPICDSEAIAILKCPQCGEVPLAEAERIAKDAIQ